MKIVYVAKHDSGGNDDEGAIVYALEELGHTVTRIFEEKADWVRSLEADFILIHNYQKMDMIRSWKLPKVFWYFDLVDYPDPLLERRNRARRDWITAVTSLVNIGFCTDGDWVERDKTGKLVRLTQGMDMRVSGFGMLRSGVRPILFTGLRGGGRQRSSHITELLQRYGDQMQIIEGRNRIHGRQLANAFASTKIVIAPDGPITDRYWSNRVYNTLGLGGFLLHPYAETLTQQYTPGEDLVMYRTRKELCELIDRYLEDEPFREKMRLAGYLKTIKNHTYEHRCAELIRIVKERL